MVFESCSTVVDKIFSDVSSVFGVLCNHTTEPAQAWAKIRAGALLVDVRTPGEYSDGHLQGAINIPLSLVRARATGFGDDKNREIVLYCNSGIRSGMAKNRLERLGYKNVLNAGGYDALREAE